MEQQNQQPIQEKTENKLPTKTNWKYLAIVAIVAIILSVGGILLFKATQAPPMEEFTLAPCDLNADGICDAADITLFQQALGTNRGDVDYNPLADADADGVVTAVDQQMLFPVTSPVLQPQTLDTSTWQTYRNDEFGFGVKYPPHWTVETTYQPEVAFFSPDGKVTVSTRLHTSGTPEYIYSLAYREEQECPPCNNPEGGCPGAACPRVKPKETKRVNINGVDGYFKELESGTLSAYLPRPDEKISIELITGYSDHKDVFNQILSTFRFVDQATENDASNFTYAFFKGLEVWLNESGSTRKIGNTEKDAKTPLGPAAWSPNGEYLAWLAADSSRFEFPDWPSYDGAPGSSMWIPPFVETAFALSIAPPPPDTVYIWSYTKDKTWKVDLEGSIEGKIAWSSRNEIMLFDSAGSKFLIFKETDDFQKTYEVANPFEYVCTKNWDAFSQNTLLLAVGDDCTLYTLNISQPASTPTKQNLSLGERFMFFEQSRNGRYIAYAKTTDTGLSQIDGVWLAERVGKEWKTTKVNNTASSAYLSFSPDSSLLAFKSNKPFEPLYVLSTKEKTVRTIPGVWISPYGWTPDGQTMIWRYRTQHNLNIFTAAVDVRTEKITELPDSNLATYTSAIRPPIQ